MRYDCVNLLDITEHSAKHFCNTCGFSETSIWNCDIEKYCTPFAKGNIQETDIPVTNCINCTKYESNEMNCVLTKKGHMFYQCKACGRKVLAENVKSLRFPCSKKPSSSSKATKSAPDKSDQQGNVIQRFLNS